MLTVCPDGPSASLNLSGAKVIGFDAFAMTESPPVRSAVKVVNGFTDCMSPLSSGILHGSDSSVDYALACEIIITRDSPDAFLHPSDNTVNTASKAFLRPPSPRFTCCIFYVVVSGFML